MSVLHTKTRNAAASEQGSTASRWSRRSIAMTAYFAAVVAIWLLWGLPTDFFVIFVLLWAASICWNIDQPRRFHVEWLRDWGPLLVLLVAYDLSRAAAKLWQEPHVTELIDADLFISRLTGLFGDTLPTLWLQEHLYDPEGAHWWDVAASTVYMSHFVASLIVAIVLYLRSRTLWGAFMRRWFTLTGLALMTYFLYPAAPPWWAAEHGYIAEPVARISTYGWSAIGMDGTGKLLNVGQTLSNPVAAMPSLHSGWAMLIVVFLLPRVRKRWWPLLLAYPLAMTFTLVYSGDHYIIDVLVGWTYVGIAFVIVGALEKWWKKRKQKNAPTSPAQSHNPVIDPVRSKQSPLSLPR